MAFIWKSPRSKFWQAGFLDKDGKRRNRSTGIVALEKLRKKADRIADEYEAVAQKKKSANHVKATLNALLKDAGLSLDDEDAFPTATVKEYCDRFMEKKKGEVGKATIRRYQTTCEHFCKWLGENENHNIATITQQHIVRLRNDWLKEVSERTVYNKLKDIRAIFASALTEGFILNNPMDGMKLKKGNEKTSKRKFSNEEINLILRESEGEWHSMIMFGLYTGQRLGDLATLRWSNLDLEQRMFRRLTRKTGVVVHIPFNEKLFEHILTLESSDDPQAFIHPTLAEHYEQKGSATISNQFGDILAHVGLREPVSHESKGNGRSAKREKTILSFHCLRRTAISKMNEEGIPPSIIRKWVGHNSVEVNESYNDTGLEALQKASNSLSYE